jgi:hypothetical protein
MAEKKIIELEVKTNIKGVNLDMKDVVKQTKEATVATQNLNQATAETGAKSSGLKAIKDTVVNLVPGLKSAEGGVNALGNSFKMLLANPIILIITAIVGALKFVYEAFQSNVKIGKEIAAVWEGLNAVGTQVKDAIFGLTRSLAYAVEAAVKFITLDFKGAGEAMKNANKEATTSYNQLSKAIDGTTFATVRKLEKEQQANNKAKKEQAVRQSEINKLLVQSREILTDENESIKAKKKALEEVTKAEKESSKEKVRTAATDLRILEEKAKALGGQAEKKMKQEIREATIALNEAETENAMTGIKLNKQRKMLLRQETEEGKAAVEEAKARAKERADAEKAAIEKRTQAEKDFYKAQSEMLEEAEKNTLKKKGFRDPVKKAISDAEKMMAAQNVINDAKVKQIEAHNEAELRLEEDKNRKKQELTAMSFDVIRSVADLFAQGNEADQRKAFQLNKAASLGQAIVNTAQGVTAALTQVPLFPGAQIIQAGLVGTLGALNIAKIANTQFQSSGGGGDTATSTPTAPRTPSFDIIQAQPQMQLGALQQQPIKAYVVSGEVSTAQALDRNRVRNATF